MSELGFVRFKDFKIQEIDKDKSLESNNLTNPNSDRLRRYCLPLGADNAALNYENTYLKRT